MKEGLSWSQTLFYSSQLILKFYVYFLQFLYLFTVLCKLVFEDTIYLTAISFLKHDDFLVKFSNKLVFLSHLLSNHLKRLCFFSTLFYLSSKSFLHVGFEILNFILVRKYLLLKRKNLFIQISELQSRRVFNCKWSDALFFKMRRLWKIGWVDKILMNKS